MCDCAPPPARQRQSDVLRRQLGYVRETLARPAEYTDFVAALMIEWHACYLRSVFAAIRTETEQLIEEAKSKGSYGDAQWSRFVPLELALQLARHDADDPVHQIAQRIEIGLWDADARTRSWIRTCVYWAAPFMEAAALRDPSVRSWQTRRFGREMPYLVSLTHGGFEELCWLRDLLPDGERDIDVTLLAAAEHGTIENPFASESSMLALYMLTESLDISEEALAWLPAGARAGDAEIDALCRRLLRHDAELSMQPTTDLRCVERQHDDGGVPMPLRCPLSIDGTWYRLVKLPSERIAVQRHGDDHWSKTDDVSPGAFIRKLREVKGV